MTRAVGSDVVAVAPSNNVYTALAGVGLLATVIALIVVFMRASSLFPNGLLG